MASKMAIPRSMLACMAIACAGVPMPEEAAAQESAVRPATCTTSDFFHLAVVPHQTIAADSFELQAIAECLDPASSAEAPVVIDAGGNRHAMARKALTWPGTSERSIEVFSAELPLLRNRTNFVKVISGTKALELPIRHKPVLSTRRVANAADLAAEIRSALANPFVDIIEIDYDEPDLGAAIHNLGNNVTSKRATWLTLKPAVNRQVGWSRNSGAPLSRPKIDLLHVSGVVFGSDVSDGGGGQYYAEPGHRVWLERVQFRGKYKASWPKNKPMTSQYMAEIRVDEREGQKVYFTDCSWDGTASNAATSGVALARDLRFNSHRGDFNNFGKVFLNAYVENANPVRNHADSDFLHNDGFQIWGKAENMVFKGFRVVANEPRTELQPFLFDRTFSPEYSSILVDTLIIENAAPGYYKAQLAGKISNSRVSNISFPLQSLTIRQDFSEVNGVFSPDNFFVDNAYVKSVEHIVPGRSRIYRQGTVSSSRDISNGISEVQSLKGLRASRVRVLAQPAVP